MDAGRGHGGDHAPGLIVVASKFEMRRGDDDFEPAALVGRHVERAVRADVGLDAFEHAKPARAAAVQVVDLGVLPRHRGHRHPTRDGQAIRVVGHATVLIPEGPARLREGFNRVGPVAPGGVHLQIAAIGADVRSAKAAILERRQHLRAGQKMRIPAIRNHAISRHS